MAAAAPSESRRIGFVATRLSGTDGVSLEVGKWARILEDMGHTCFFIAGESSFAAERSLIIPEAHFKHPIIASIGTYCFGHTRRNPDITVELHEMTWVIKEKLHTAIRKFNLDLLIAENCVTIPMNIPLGLAVVETVMETGIGCIAHHHDFTWERERFLVNAVDDYLRAAFPPSLPQMQHVVINSLAAMEFSRRTSLPCRVIPNVMDFEHPPSPPDEFTAAFRPSVGLSSDDILLLQPTRIVQRKGIEHAVELVHRLDDPRVKLVITHRAGDEGERYADRVQKYARLLRVPLILAESWIAEQRQCLPDGTRRFTIGDAYHQADFVSYPSAYEGFGNAFLESVYYKKPLFCNRYSIYRTDIEPCGFDVILMDGFLTDDVVEQVRTVLHDENRRREMVERNYEMGKQFFSYRRVDTELRAILAKPRVGHMA